MRVSNSCDRLLRLVILHSRLPFVDFHFFGAKGMFPKVGFFPPKWMVKVMENPSKMDDLGVALFLETPI